LEAVGIKGSYFKNQPFIFFNDFYKSVFFIHTKIKLQLISV
jgi:hypothetical protein